MVVLHIIPKPKQYARDLIFVMEYHNFCADHIGYNLRTKMESVSIKLILQMHQLNQTHRPISNEEKKRKKSTFMNKKETHNNTCYYESSGMI